MKYIKIDEVKPNMLSASNLYDCSHRTIIRANCRLTEPLITEIIKKNYAGLYIYREIDTLSEMTDPTHNEKS